MADVVNGGSEQRQPRSRGGLRAQSEESSPQRDGRSWFGQGMSVEMCAHWPALLPIAFPVVHRTGTATLRMIAVERRDERVLLCDGSHQGPHQWPNGDIPATGTDTDATS